MFGFHGTYLVLQTHIFSAARQTSVLRNQTWTLVCPCVCTHYLSDVWGNALVCLHCFNPITIVVGSVKPRVLQEGHCKLFHLCNLFLLNICTCKGHATSLKWLLPHNHTKNSDEAECNFHQEDRVCISILQNAPSLSPPLLISWLLNGLWRSNKNLNQPIMLLLSNFKSVFLSVAVSCQFSDWLWSLLLPSHLHTQFPHYSGVLELLKRQWPRFSLKTLGLRFTFICALKSILFLLQI